MANSKIVVGKIKSEKREVPYDRPVAVKPWAPLEAVTWGNDNDIISRLDEVQRAERRLFARARCFQRTESEVPGMPANPVSFIVSDLSMGGIDIICEQRLEMGTILDFKLVLDSIEYAIKCEVVYCISNKERFRIGLKLAQKDKFFIKHLKIYVARISIQNMLI